MVFMWHRPCCLLLLVTLACASREEADLNEFLELEKSNVVDDYAKIFKEESNLVCGGTFIRETLSKDSGRSVNWPTIMAHAENFIQQNQVLLDRLQKDVENLEKEIPLKEAAESPKDMTTEQIVDLITKSLGIFGGVNNAKEGMCGGAKAKVKKELKIPAGAFRKSSKEFETLAQPVLEGKVRVSGERVVKECSKIVPEPAGQEAASWCEELCQSFGKFAGKESNRISGVTAGAKADELRQQLAERTQELKHAIAEQSECQEIKRDLGGFREVLEKLNMNIREEHEKLMDAQEALEEAEDKVADLEEELEEQQATTQKAVAALQGTGANVKKAQEAFSKVMAMETTLKKDIADTKSKLEDLKTSMEVSQTAVSAVSELHSMVSMLSLKMKVLYEAVVKTPLNTLGIYEATNIAEYFEEPVEELESREQFEATLNKLRDHCETKAKPAFEQISNKQDLMQLCDFGGVQPALDGVDKSVKTRKAGLQKALGGLQQLLNPYNAMKGMTEGLVMQKFVKEGGEPAGVRPLLPRFGKAAFYSGYLKKWWARSKGGYLELSKKLGAAIENMQKEQEAAMAKFAELEKSSKANVELKTAAKAALEAAVKANEIATASKKQAEDALASTKTQLTAAQSNLEELARAEEEARKRFEVAKDKLKVTHSTALGLSFIQALEELNETQQPMRTKLLPSGQSPLGHDLA